MKHTFNNMLIIAFLLSATHYSAMHAAEQAVVPAQQIMQWFLPFSEQDKKIAQEKRNLLTQEEKNNLDALLINVINNKNKNLIEWQKTDVVTIRTLLRAGADAKAKTKIGRPIIVEAAIPVDAALILADLIAAGADPNALNKKTGSTALLCAVCYGLTANVQVLLDKGANSKLKTKNDVFCAREGEMLTALEFARIVPTWAREENDPKSIAMAKIITMLEGHNNKEICD